MKSSLHKQIWFRAALSVAATGVVLALLFAFLPLGELWTAMRRVPAKLWLVFLAAFLTTHVIGILKWRLMVNSAGAGLGILDAAHCYLGGLFGALFLPSIVGGDFLRLGLGLRRTRSKAGLMLASVVDRLLDFAALASVAGIGALLLSGMLEPRLRRLARLVILLVLFLSFSGLVLTSLLARRGLVEKLHRRLVHLRRAAKALGRRPQRVLLAFCLGIVVQTSLVVLSAAIAKVCGLSLALPVWLFAWPLSKLSGMLPITQGGIGVREAALSALLVPFGGRPALAVAVGFVWETLIIAGGSLGGLFSVLLGRRRIPQRVAVTGMLASTPTPAAQKEYLELS